MQRMRNYEKTGQKKIANERIEILFKLAGGEFNKHPELSNRYVEIARDIAMKLNIKLQPALKRKFCKKCGCFLVNGKNCRVRLNSEKKYILQTCLNCGNKLRHPYKK